ncbi:MAG: cobalamin B12-binding domain-containing protein, partial [Eubacterium sp.]|nr:cobalamin B12-binding domain-containing protein [Eubacterium sp.]
YGIDRSDIVIDGLAMAVSSDSRGAMTTLETIRRISRDGGGNTILGVSNVSFGLPNRGILNAAFLTMALQEGLSCAIINPDNEDVMRVVRAFRALTDRDRNFEQYLKAYADAAPEPKKTAASKGESLGDCVLKGLAGRAREQAEAMLKEKEPLEIIDGELIPALDEVGRGFEKGTIFLPQLLMSADAAQAAFAVIKESFPESENGKKGKIILATVKNDIHDIGKNIVKVMLENYGYEVLDLGKNVPPEMILDCAEKEDVRLVGLSALMTTTVVSMEETIALLRKHRPGTKVVVGGAVLTHEFAERIGADCYAKDAMATVRYADSVFEN